MTGLEKILQEIRDEAAKEAEQAAQAANAEAEKIMAAAKADADAKAAAIKAAAAHDVAEIERSRDSAAQLQRRQRTLAQKQMLLAETLKKAEQALCDLPEDEYFDLLVRLAAANAQPGEGELYLGQKDAARLPKDFTKKLDAALPEGCALKVAGATRPIDGGFVLMYGDVEENCSFEAIFNARADEFSDLVRDTLFA